MTTEVSSVETSDFYVYTVLQPLRQIFCVLLSCCCCCSSGEVLLLLALCSSSCVGWKNIFAGSCIESVPSAFFLLI